MAHGTVLNQPAREKYHWFNDTPINGCYLITEDDSAAIHAMWDIYKEKSGHNDLAALQYFCNFLDQNVRIRERTNEYRFFAIFGDRLARIRIKLDEIYEWPDFRRDENITQLTEKSAEIISVASAAQDNEYAVSHETNKLLRKAHELYNLFVDCAPSIKKIILELRTRQSAEQAAALDGDYETLETYFITIKRIFDSLQLFRRHHHKVKCQFMRMKKNKQLIFNYSGEKSGLYVLDATREIPADLLMESHIPNVLKFKKYRNGFETTLDDLVADMKSLGFNNVVVYDRTCNINEDGDDFEMSDFSSMDSTDSQSFTPPPPPAGGRRTRRPRRQRK